MTGLDGSYQLVVPQGSHLVAASNPDYAPQARRVEVGPDGGVADFRLVPGGAIEGVVSDGRAPVPGAHVIARRSGAALPLAEPGPHEVITDEDGKFRLSGLRPGMWDLSARANHHHTRAPTVIGLAIAEAITGVELVIAPGPVLRGRVVDETGAPAPNATIDATGEREPFPRATTIADATGAFAFDDLAPGPYQLTAVGKTYLRGPAVHVDFADQDVELVVTIKRGITVRGHVESRQVCTISRILDLANLQPPLTFLADVVTRSDGAFELGPVDVGPVLISAHCPSGEHGDLSTTAAPGMPEVVVRVAQGASIAGRVVDRQGAAVSGVTIAAHSVSNGTRLELAGGALTSGAQDLSRVDGGFEIKGLAEGSYILTALDRGKPLPAQAMPDLVLGATERRTGVELVVDPPRGVIAGVVTGPDGAPVTDAWVEAAPDIMAMLRDASAGDQRANLMTFGPGSRGFDDGAAAPVLTDAQGHYQFTGLYHAHYSVQAAAQHGELRARMTDVVPAEPGRPPARADLRLAPGDPGTSNVPAKPPGTNVSPDGKKRRALRSVM